MKECKYRMMLKPKERGCIEHNCIHYQSVLGNNPQTGESVEKYMCSDLLHNILIIENSQMGRQTGAAVESFRNEMTKHQETFNNILQQGLAQKKLKNEGGE